MTLFAPVTVATLLFELRTRTLPSRQTHTATNYMDNPIDVINRLIAPETEKTSSTLRCGLCHDMGMGAPVMTAQAKEAAISRRTLYKNFGSKEEIVDVFIKVYTTSTIIAIKAGLEHQWGPAQKNSI